MSDRVKGIQNERLREVVHSYERGQGINEIAKRIGVSGPTVSKWLRKEGYRKLSKGRYPAAMKLRTKDLAHRRWRKEEISNLLRVSVSCVEKWLRPEKNPSVLGGEKDPLKIKSGLPKKRKQAKSRKRYLTKSEWKGPIPKAHRCRKHWTNEIEAKYIFELMKRKVSILKIYKHMHASKKIQQKIWTQFGGKGRPPNFPSKKSPEEEKRQLQKLKAISETRESKLQKDYEKLREKNLELEASIEEEQEKGEALKAAQEEKRKQLTLEVRAAKERMKALEAWKKKAKPPALPPRAPKTRVTVGSYEAEVLGLPVGSIIKKPKEPRARPRRAPKVVAEWADNGEFFEVSNEWGDLGELNSDKGATEDELQIFADFLTKEGFPAKVTPKGDQPRAHYKDIWPKNIERKWTRATGRAITFLDAYTARKQKLVESKFSPKIAQNILRYLKNAYDAFRNPDTTPKQRSKAESRMKRIWQGLDTIDRALLIFWRGFADRSGTPTQKALEWGITAKRLLVKEDEGRIAKHLAKRKKTREKASARDLLEARKRELGLLPPDEE